MQGQIKIDFIFGMVVFSVIIIFIVTQTNTTFSSLLVDSKSDSLKAKASNAINLLVEDGGNPRNWDVAIAQGHPENVIRIGLADIPYNLSRSKVMNLSYNCSNSGVYGNLLRAFDFGAYRLRVFNSTQRILLCGFDSLSPWPSARPDTSG